MQKTTHLLYLWNKHLSVENKGNKKYEESNNEQKNELKEEK